VASEGLADRVEIRLQDYREVPDGPFDAIASVGMFEHVGEAELGEYFRRLHGLAAPGARFLNHAISRPPGERPGVAPRSFMGRYVFPDSALVEVGTVVTAMQAAGFEACHVEGLREHYALTLRAWLANLERSWEEAVTLAGPNRARVWRLYIAGSAAAFDAGRIGIHQVLGVRTEEGRHALPLRPDWQATPTSEGRAAPGPRPVGAGAGPVIDLRPDPVHGATGVGSRERGRRGAGAPGADRSRHADRRSSPS
jgi:cyclopropane-fatty-acyl-phospholipid synthase